MPPMPMMMQAVSPAKAEAMKELETIKGLWKIHTPDAVTCPKCRKYGMTVTK